MNNVVTLPTAPNPEARVKRDRYGRYMIPDPTTGQERPWTRATTLANTLADRFGLEQWSKRNVVLGLGARSDLYAQAASCKPEDRDALNRIVDQAEEAAKSSAGANLGTALHRFTERLDAGEDVSVPEPWAGDVAAYRKTMEAHGISVVPGWIEQILLVPELGAAGTCDRLCMSSAWSLPRIGDVKTGKDVLRYSMTEIALQEAIYSRATFWFDPFTSELHKITEQIDQDRAMVMHLPVGQGVCNLYEVDIAAGWEAVQLAVAVRDWRKRHDLAELMVPGASDPAFDQRLAWIHERVKALIAHPEAGVSLAELWSSRLDVPTFKAGGPTTHDQIDVIAGMCDLAELAHEIPFGASDPAAQKVTKQQRKEQTKS